MKISFTPPYFCNFCVFYLVFVGGIMYNTQWIF